MKILTEFSPKKTGQNRSRQNNLSIYNLPKSKTGIEFQIKEKSERSLGMDVARHRASQDAGYAYDNETMAGYTRRQSAAPGSRNGSRPPSRTGSNLSLDSEDSPRGGVRRTSSMRSGASAGRPPYRQTPVGFGSSTPRKTSTPATNGKGRTPSNSSMDRTPMAGR